MSPEPEPGPVSTPGTGKAVLNADVAWDRWPVETYITEIYAELHPSDAAVIDHHSAFYRELVPDSIARSLEFGAGPNLYPMMLAAACSRRIDAVEPGSANVAYLQRQLTGDPDEHWLAFYERCRRGNDSLPASATQALSRVRVHQGNGLHVPRDTYDLASMHFVAEGASEARTEFEALCHAFIRSARPGGHLIAAFMENLPSYQLAGRRWPAYPVDTAIVREVFGPHTEKLEIDRIDNDPTLPAYGDTGMILLTARRTGR